MVNPLKLPRISGERTVCRREFLYVVPGGSATETGLSEILT
jgi:hypothetical protein